LQLFLLADMQEELDDAGVILPVEKLFEVVDVSIPLRPLIFWNQLVDAGYQHILIMRTVEKCNRPLGGRMEMNPPQEIMVQL
jgi:hypothetical protein